MIMEEILKFTPAEREMVIETFKSLCSSMESGFSASDYRFIKERISRTALNGGIVRDNFGFNPIVTDLLTIQINTVDPLSSSISLCLRMKNTRYPPLHYHAYVLTCNDWKRVVACTISQGKEVTFPC